MTIQLQTNKTHLESQFKLKAHNNGHRKAPGMNPSSNFTPNFYNPFEIKRRRRTSREQARLLEEAYIKNPKPNGKARHQLAEALSMSPRGVQVWFQNKRAKEKQQRLSKEASFSTTNMMHSCSQSSTYSDPVPTADQVQQPFMTWYPAQSQIQLNAQCLPWSLSHQTYQIANTNLNDHASQIQQCPYMYLDNTLTYHQSVDDWVDNVSLFHHDHMYKGSSKMPVSYLLPQQDESYWTGQQIMRHYL